jgi:hypothetical protein
MGRRLSAEPPFFRGTSVMKTEKWA